MSPLSFVPYRTEKVLCDFYHLRTSDAAVQKRAERVAQKVKELGERYRTHPANYVPRVLAQSLLTAWLMKGGV